VGVEVVAVEPDAAMLSELHRALRAVRALPGAAEGIPLADGSVDAVLAGNALHWFEMADAGPEIARVLAPEGAMAGLWNVVDDRVDWVAELARVSGSAAIGPRDTFSSWRTATADLHLARDGSVARFGSPEQREFAHGQLRTARSLVATLATRAGMLLMPEREPRVHAADAHRRATHPTPVKAIARSDDACSVAVAATDPRLLLQACHDSAELGEARDCFDHPTVAAAHDRNGD
jgi:SAM-dependent methyltransferase